MEKSFRILKIPNLLLNLLERRRFDWVHQAASSTHDAMCHLSIRYERCADGKGLSHAMWLLREIKEGQVTGKKAHRWLGWAQCILTYEDVLTLEDSKMINKQVSEG